MTVQVPAMTNFAGGQTSHDISGRPDLAQYGSSFAVLRNMIGAVQGNMRRRPGTRVEGRAKRDDVASWLVPWAFEPGDAVMLEFSHRAIRFFGDGGQILGPGGAPLEVETPYAAADLVDDDGLFLVRVEQSADVLYVTHPGYPPQRLIRRGATDWAFEPLEFEGGPWQRLNTDETSTVYASGVTGTVTLTSSAGVFDLGQVGGFVEILNGDDVAYAPWEPRDTTVQNGSQRIYDGRVYEAVNDEVGAPDPVKTGGREPTHTKGVEADGADVGGDTNVRWRYLHDQRGYVRIVEFLSPTQVRAEVVERLPREVVGAGNATPNWRHGVWSDWAGWPSDVAFYSPNGERLAFAQGSAVYFSQSADFDNFDPDEFGTTTDESAFDVTVADRGFAPIRWLSSTGSGLGIGTSAGESVTRQSSFGDVFSPKNRVVLPQSSYGSSAVRVAHPHRATAFVERDGRRVRLAAYDGAADRLVANDATILAREITKPRIVDMAWQASAFQVLWCVRGDGLLLGMLYDPEQGVLSWWPQETAGQVESVAVRPTSDGDELWLSVKRTINGATRRFVERMADYPDLANPYENLAYEDAYRDAVRATQWLPYHVDCGVTYEGAATSVISGLDHLEGEEVAILAEGAHHPRATVRDGSIALRRAVTFAHIGLPFESFGLSHRLEAAASQGSIAQASTRRLVGAAFRVFNSGEFLFGQSLERRHLVRMPMRYQDERSGEGAFLKSGDFFEEAEGTNGSDCRLAFLADTALPLEILAIFPKVQGGGVGGAEVPR